LSKYTNGLLPAPVNGAIEQNMSPKILVTAATGNIGTHIVKYLSDKGVEARALVRDPDKAAPIRMPGVEIVTGSFEDAASLDRALEGIERVFLLVSVPGRDLELQGNLIAAATRAGLRHIVNMSMWGAVPDSPISFARAHWEKDQQVAECGIAYTLLRPNLFMQNFLRSAPTVSNMGVLSLPMQDARVSLIDIRDIAAVAAALLVEGGYQGEALILTGSEALAYREAADRIGRVIGKEVKYVSPPFEEVRANRLKAGMTPLQASDVVEIYRLFSSGYGERVYDTVTEVARKEPITFDQFVRDHAAAFGGKEAVDA
jgi:uncharacterized protein YbjT (DUF2867 family)